MGTPAPLLWWPWWIGAGRLESAVDPGVWHRESTRKMSISTTALLTLGGATEWLRVQQIEAILQAARLSPGQIAADALPHVWPASREGELQPASSWRLKDVVVYCPGYLSGEVPRW